MNFSSFVIFDSTWVCANGRNRVRMLQQLYSILPFLLGLQFLCPSCSAYGDVYVMNTTLICKACETICSESLIPEELIKDCQRGCRFFNSLAATPFAPFDDSAAVYICNQSCAEAYMTTTLARKACCEGCGSAHQLYRKVYKFSLEWLHGNQRRMTFGEKLLDYIVALFPTAAGVDAGLFVEEIDGGNGTIKTRLKDIQRSDDYDGRPSKEKDPAIDSPVYVSQSLFMLLSLGSFLMLYCCGYCCLYLRIISDKDQSPSAEDLPDLPPSYDHLVKDGILILPCQNEDDVYYVLQSKGLRETGSYGGNELCLTVLASAREQDIGQSLNAANTNDSEIKRSLSLMK